jgi:hypothetical protein
MSGEGNALMSVEAEPFLPPAPVVASAVTRVFRDRTLVPNIGPRCPMLRNGEQP